MRLFTKYNLLLFVFLFLFSTGKAQNKLLSGWNIGAKIGASRMIGEFPNNFSEAITEFDYKFGFVIDGELSKLITNHSEIGFELNHSILKGENQNPSFSAQGHHPAFMEPFTEPVEFNNKLFGQKIFFRYYFKDVSEIRDGFNMVPFIRGGIGYLSYSSKLKEMDANNGDIIFGKGANNGTKLSTAVFSLGTGFKTMLSEKFYTLVSVDFNAVNYDFLDVVHNYNENGDRLELLGIYTDLKVGIFYIISGNQPGKGRSRKSAIQQYLPFGR